MPKCICVTYVLFFCHADDTRPYSAQTTTSSEPSEFEDDDYDYENLEKENIRLMMEEEELEAIGAV